MKLRGQKRATVHEVQTRSLSYTSAGARARAAGSTSYGYNGSSSAAATYHDYRMSTGRGGRLGGATTPSSSSSSTPVRQPGIFYNSSSAATAAASHLLSQLDQFPHPNVMDSETLGKAAVTASREQIHAVRLWDAFMQRAKHLAELHQLDPRDAALLVNAVCKIYCAASSCSTAVGQSQSRQSSSSSASRQVGQSQSGGGGSSSSSASRQVPLRQRYLPMIVGPEGEIRKLFFEKIAYFNATYLAMMLSAFGKCGLKLTESERLVMVKELKIRVPDLQQTTEQTMFINAITKLELNDDELWKRLSTHLQTRMQVEPFHIRDLSVIAKAFADAAVVQDKRLFESIAYHAKFTIGEATPLEIARVIHSFARCGMDEEQFVRYCVSSAGEKLLFNTPAELSTVAYAFGMLLEYYRAVAQRLEQTQMLANTAQTTSTSSSPSPDNISQTGSTSRSNVDETGLRKVVDTGQHVAVVSCNAQNPSTSSTKVEQKLSLLRSLYAKIRKYSLSSLHLFELKDLTAVLVVFSRWEIAFPLHDLAVFANRVLQEMDSQCAGSNSPHSNFPAAELAKLLNSTALLYTRGMSQELAEREQRARSQEIVGASCGSSMSPTTSRRNETTTEESLQSPAHAGQTNDSSVSKKYQKTFDAFAARGKQELLSVSGQSWILCNAIKQHSSQSNSAGSTSGGVAGSCSSPGGGQRVVDSRSKTHGVAGARPAQGRGPKPVTPHVDILRVLDSLQLLTGNTLCLADVMRIIERRVFKDVLEQPAAVDRLIRSRYIAHFQQAGYDERWDDILALLVEQDNKDT
ncbi:unnamed protein product [Amoebophrya sp. A120]|nr:unnamed protein product [Amoebophrya sp. A120]|eukprot:GSA120T00016675001.1